MNRPAGSARPFGLRTIVFVALAAVVVVAVMGSGRQTMGARSPWGRLYRRAGDTYAQAFYLASSTGPRTLDDDPILGLSLGYYTLSARVDPNDPRTRLSQALVLATLGRTKESEKVLREVLKRERDEAGRARVRAVLLTVGSASPSPAQIEAVQKAVGDLTPGPAFLAGLYAASGDQEGATRTLLVGRARAGSLIAPLLAGGAVCTLILLAGAVGLAVYVVTWRRRRRAWPPPRARWGLREGAEALILFFIIQVVAGTALLLLWPGLMDSQPFVLFIPSVLGGLGAIGWMRMVAPDAGDLGWRARNAWRQMLIGISVAGLMVPLVWGLELLVQALTKQLPAESPLVPFFTEAVTWPARLSLLLGTVAVVPVVEETVFRGLLYGGMRRVWSVPIAAAASGVIFAVGHPHTGIIGLLPYVAIGAVLAWLYERTGSLVAPAAAHGAFNLFFVTALLVLYR